MQGKLLIKSKVLQSKRTKSSVGKRRVKPKRSNTPQRWSRRIRSLPPIPINVLSPRRKVKNKRTQPIQETFTSTTTLNEVQRESISQNFRGRRSKTAPIDKSDSVEMVRIVPVVVYVKNSVKQKKLVPEEIRMHINDNSTCKMVSHIINSHIRKKIKQKFGLGARHSQRIRAMARESSVQQTAKRKHPTRRKIPLSH